MSSLGASGGWLLELGKFAAYLTVPAAVTFAIATDSKTTLYKLMGFVPCLTCTLIAESPIEVNRVQGVRVLRCG
ncbi:hypothetical protein BHE74_00058137 [Ensete ventricosum]|nr:hypothetical protein BHE74_00058137 [Ensete ventricosum]RZS28309.1 hypothetical protein BHM03_00061896 [Ensete ventricosum]